ncbi:MAG: toxin [Elusimicrobia bacterium RIFCSPLOWO2_01_FULL_64_13]|nr:MAG: toxin [Elusimicrobia bacterium RIFCSPHIGHO2_01_FULL_64_10]OGR96369.1 MAG: toxin [Elusimicrobia bacterium RIFCSPLOWO2_01_FULL_64_13]
MRKRFAWDAGKNDWLKANRGISFEEVVFSIEQGGLLETTGHPNKARYPNQRMFTVLVSHYVYLVPFVEDQAAVFLKTIIPSRKSTRKFLKGGN